MTIKKGSRVRLGQYDGTVLSVYRPMLPAADVGRRGIKHRVEADHLCAQVMFDGAEEPTSGVRLDRLEKLVVVRPKKQRVA